MWKSQRTLVATFVVAALSLSGGMASALSSVNLVWKSNGLDTIHAAPSSTVTALIVLQGDSPVGISGMFVSILFDTVELDVLSVLEHSGHAAKVDHGMQFAPISAGVTIDEAGWSDPGL